MNSKFRKYWEKRSEDIQKVADKSADEYLNSLKKSYIAAKNKIIEKTEAFYGRYAKDNQIDLSEARKRLTPDQVKTFREYNAEYYAEIKNLGDDAFTAEYKAKLRDMSGRAYISRQQELLANINHEIEMLYIKSLRGDFINQNIGFTDIMKTAYKDSYYQNIYKVLTGGLYNLQKTGLDHSFTKIDNKTVEKAVMQKWHGDNFSGRIWQSKENLIQWLENNIPKDFVRGYGARELSKDLAERMAIKYHEAERLVRTEISHISNQATIDSYKEMGIEYYKILAEIDSKTSEICADMNGKTFKLSEAVPGITVPPFHPNCRSTTVAHFPEDEKNVEFDSDMNSVVSDMVQDILSGKDFEQTFTEWAKNNADSEYAAQLAENSEKYKDFDENILQISDNHSIIDSGGDTKIMEIGKIDFNDEKAVFELIENFFEKNAYADVENSLIISPKGNFYNLGGNKISVDSSIVGQDNLKGSICIHNHPIPDGKIMDDSFSRQDLGFAAEFKTDKQYLVSGERRDVFEYIGNLTREEIENKYNEAYYKLLELALNGEAEIEFESQQTLEILNDMLEGFKFYGNLRK